MQRRQRQCGDCQLCCRLLPVKAPLDKPAYHRCKFQRYGRGCTVHARLMRVSPACAIWNCRWLVDEAGRTARPDHAHYVIDVMPDVVRVSDDATGKIIAEEIVVQVWVDPAFPDAHRDPALRDWLQSSEQMALIRRSDETTFLLIPPARNTAEGWIEHTAKRNDLVGLWT